MKSYNIIYEDNYIIVIDKPSGLLVIPTPKRETNTLTDLLNRDLDDRKVEVNAYPCHRLDRETSGLIVYAKGKKMQQAVMEQFKERKVKKFYIAFAQGRVKKEAGIIDRAIYNRNKLRSENAVTKYKVLERRNGFSILEVEPMTGRTNQIRIHMKEIGHPLLGERIYAFRKDFKIKFKRVALHASHIEFTHPAYGRKLEFSSEVPQDMRAVIDNRS